MNPVTTDLSRAQELTPAPPYSPSLVIIQRISWRERLISAFSSLISWVIRKMSFGSAFCSVRVRYWLTAFTNAWVRLIPSSLAILSRLVMTLCSTRNDVDCFIPLLSVQHRYFNIFLLLSIDNALLIAIQYHYQWYVL